VAPTRELALQIAAVLEEAGSRCGVSSVCVYGGVPKQPQAAALRGGVDVVVGTPGRLEDLMQDGACRLQVRAGARVCVACVFVLNGGRGERSLWHGLLLTPRPATHAKHAKHTPPPPPPPPLRLHTRAHRM
jgi:hypothetical protein